MKTLSTSSTRKKATICTGGEQSPMEDLNFNYPSNVQEVEYVRAAGVRHYDRKNQRFDQVFTILYKLSTVADAEAKILGLSDQPNFGTVQFITESGFGGASTFTHTNASCQVAAARQIGSAVLVSYRIRGGRLAPI